MRLVLRKTQFIRAQGVLFNEGDAWNDKTTLKIHQIPPPRSESALARSPSPATGNFEEHASSLPHKQGGFTVGGVLRHCNITIEHHR